MYNSCKPCLLLLCGHSSAPERGSGVGRSSAGAPQPARLSRRSLARLDLLRAVVLAALTAALALPLGLALAWALLAVVNVEAFGWRLPMYLFPLEYLRLTGLALLAAAIAASWPAWRLSRTPPAQLLGVFRNER